MVIFGRCVGQLDDRSGSTENLSAAIEDKMVMGGDKGQSNL
jgi:hypothetical protein